MVYTVFFREITNCTTMYSVCIRFWSTLFDSVGEGEVNILCGWVRDSVG
jgi:hypothetical protein